ncbi:AI-2E family transporter [Planococcus shenhongbingii]|uniref:AI-2E family transporter n=1 Tax=Planococcus shenhongbingii TaxID=3058398 RepID=A0ABT8NGF5_9BACL|nr:MULTISPECIES: AI-2E family transporter [unclassified Planococcus (in: firmicutes)]MDN7246963.1 AI-2E family transporter [Planococcus sp. N017]WKA56866.1 AI-2E family transporter [Planococcus sp. N016]
MEPEKEKLNMRTVATWFGRWFLNNKLVAILLVVLLVFLNLYLLSRITFLFWPIQGFFKVMGLPIVMSGVLYYLLNPLIDWMEKKNIPRVSSIIMVFGLLLGLIIWGVTILIPILREQFESLLANLPAYIDSLVIQIDSLLRSDVLSQLQSRLTGDADGLTTSITDQTDEVVDTTVTGIGSVVGVVTNTVLALITTPIILFYLLKDGHNLPYHIMNLVPSRMREKTYVLLKEMNLQISQYIRGQLLVAFFVGLMFFIGFTIIGLEYGLILAIMAGALNLIPFLGSFIAFIPIVIVALVAHPPLMLAKVLVVFFIEQTLEGRIIQPLILGSNLNIHPVTIIAVLLTAGQLFGIAGVVLGIPVFAVCKVVFVHLFIWYRTYTGLYDDNFNPAPKPLVSEKKKRKQLSVRKKLQ